MFFSWYIWACSTRGCVHFLWHSNLQRDWKGCQGENQKSCLTLGFMQKRRWQPRPNWGSLEALWASSLASPSSVGSRSSTTWSGSSSPSGFPGPIWSLLLGASLRTIWWKKSNFKKQSMLKCINVHIQRTGKMDFNVCTIRHKLWNRYSNLSTLIWKAVVETRKRKHFDLKGIIQRGQKKSRGRM